MRLPTRRKEEFGVKARLQSFLNIVYALMMHDIKNRFFGSGIGQIVMVIWPFAHIMVLIAIYTFSQRPHPYGETLIQYAAVSIFPFICWNYMSRWIAMSAASNKSFLNYPIIRPIDILIARALLEVVSISIVAFLLIAFVTATGSNAIPDQPAEAVLATLSTMFLALGFGFLNAPFAFIIPLWNIVMVLFIISAYAASGIVFVPDRMPAQILYYLKFNPLLHCVEWMRTAYYNDYPTDVVDKMYVLEFALVCLTVGLVLLRAFRRLI